LTLFVGWQEGHPACKKYGAWWMWALVSSDGVAPSRMAGVSASVNLRLHCKVQKFSSGTGSPGGPGKRARKRLWCGVVWWWLYFKGSVSKQMDGAISQPAHPGLLENSH